MKKFILVVPSFDGTRYTLNQNYLKVLKNSNLTYYISDYNISLIENNNIVGILLTGGGDIGQKYLKEPLHFKATDVYEHRDDFEITLLKTAYLKNIPTLAICRGAQIMNIAFGGSIKQHIEGHLQKEERHIPTHDIFIDQNSYFYDIIGKHKIKVNSIHHQVINEIANGFKQVAFSKDGFTEAIELINDKNYFLGVQWHPESLFDINSKKIFENFLERVYNFI